MAFWKKLLIWLGVAFGLCIIFVCVLYFTLINIHLPEMTLGRYNLTKITEFAGADEALVEQFDTPELYLLVKADNELESHSADKGLSEGAYNYVLSDNELVFYHDDENGELACGGFYSGSAIKVFIKTDETTYYYYYVLQSEEA